MNRNNRLRRSAGIVLLLIGCVICIWWFKSQFYWDQCQIIGRQCLVSITSCDGKVWLKKRGVIFEWPKRYTLPKITTTSISLTPSPAGDVATQIKVNTDREGRLQFCGLKYRWACDDAESIVAIPYAYIDLPIAVLSFFLLRSKPRLPKPLAAT